MIWVRDDDGEPLHLPFHPLPGIIPEGATHGRCCKHVNCRSKWFCHTFRDAGRLGVVLWGLWLVNAVAGFCFRICHRW